MSQFDELAQLYDNYEGQTLVDFFPLYLPCHIVFLDAVTIEHRTLPAISEFALRAISTKLTNAEEIAGLLGLSMSYARSVLTGLENDEFIGQDAFGRYKLQRRALEVLAAGEDLVPVDRRLTIAWDPIAKRVLPRTPMYTPGRIAEGAVVAPVAGGYSQVAVSDIDLKSLKESRAADRENAGNEEAKFDVIRLTQVHKILMRLRETLGLVYRSAQGEVLLRIVVDGRVDDELSAICAQKSLPKNIGVDKATMQRTGVAAVKKRYGNLNGGGGEASNGVSLEQLTRARAMLRFKIDGLNRRLAEGPNSSVFEKQKNALLELEVLESKLEKLPVVPLRCYEVRRFLLDALGSAKATLTISTSLPAESQVDAVLLQAIKAALIRGVRVHLLIAGRMEMKNGAMARLNRLSERDGLEVDFLATVARPVFEIILDSSCLLFANESPLGLRPAPPMPREFAGYLVSDSRMVGEYVKSHLTFGKEDFVKRVGPLRNQGREKSKSAKSSTKMTSRPH